MQKTVSAVGSKLVYQKDIKFADQDAKEIVWEYVANDFGTPVTFQYKEIILSKSNVVFHITIEHNTPELNQILSSFKFIK